MKVIDLLNKKANGEELPSEINCYNQAFYLSDGIYIAKNQVGKYFEDYFDFSSLDYEVEIIKDKPSFNGFKVKDGEIIYKEDKKIEKFSLLDVKTPERLKKKLNELVDYINKE